jgi:hypothetical protein
MILLAAAIAWAQNPSDWRRVSLGFGRVEGGRHD